MTLRLCIDCATIYLVYHDGEPLCPQCGQSMRLTMRDRLELVNDEEKKEAGPEPAWEIR